MPELPQEDEPFCAPLLNLNLREEEVIDFEGYKKSIDRGYSPLFARPRSFSEPKGAERYIPYAFTIEDAFHNQPWVGEKSPPRDPLPSAFETLPEESASPEPGSPARDQLDMIDDVIEEPGRHDLVSQS